MRQAIAEHRRKVATVNLRRACDDIGNSNAITFFEAVQLLDPCRQFATREWRRFVRQSG
jgi:hypothetical protein